ncbi:hypothetical protein D3C81_1131450 [compost metagenome]
MPRSVLQLKVLPMVTFTSFLVPATTLPLTSTLPTTEPSEDEFVTVTGMKPN